MERFNIHNLGNSYCDFGFGSYFGHGSWFMGGFISILFWILIAYIAITIIQSLFSLGRRKKNDPALEILRGKFAAGEISEQEYLARRTVLKN